MRRLPLRAAPARRFRVPRPWGRPVRERNPVAVAVVGLVLLVLAGLLAFNARSLPLLGGGTSYSADFAESAGLRKGDEVRVAGVRVGEVDGVGLDGPKVKVRFTVKDTWIGDRSTVAIGVKTLLGAKYLAVDPRGAREQDPDRRIPLQRTTSPYDVVDAFTGLGETVGELDTDKIAKSFDALSDAFAHTSPHVRKAAKGLSALSRTVSTRDTELAELLRGANRVTGTLSKQRTRFENLIRDGNTLLAEVRARRDAIHRLFTGSRDLGKQLGGLVDDNSRQIGPALDALDRVTGVLAKNRRYLDRALATAGPYYRLVGNALGNGRWMDSYLCGLVPRDYLPAGTPPATGCMPPKRGGGR
ncbi:MCE family protein [Streptomyces boncukensis]|uniref:MCE family protein n=1 Tax=Streptomyces boncukensis TaxID=2711219 RepID=A0A6G4X1D6_9ACTN|nr:MCE family protein [Streptomyces boncukensis]NGO71198.1 MCE family protein [Streptomyces boncukensis]